MDRTGFTVWRFVVPPCSERDYGQADWSDALVVVERGAIELEAVNGLCRTFVMGDVLTLARTPLRVIRNRNPVTAVLSATSRIKRTRRVRQFSNIRRSEFHDDTQA